MKKLLILCSILLVPFWAVSQTATVNGTIQDPTTQVFANGTLTIQFVPTPGATGPFTVSGAPIQLNGSNYAGPVTLNLDGTGSFSTTMSRNDFIFPSQSKWQFIACPNASAACTTANFTIASASVNLGTLINPVIPNISVVAGSGVPRAYSNSELIVTPNPGQNYWNVVGNTFNFWNGSTWLQVATLSSAPTFTGLTLTGGMTGTTSNFSGAISALSLTVGSITSTGSVTCHNFANYRCVDVNNSAGWSGSNFGAWVNSAIADLGCSNGGHIIIPAGQIGSGNWTTAINANGCIGIKIHGAGGITGGAFTCCMMIWNGTGSPITASGSEALELDHMMITWNNAAFVGPVVELSDGVSVTNDPEIHHSLFIRSGLGANAPIIIDLDHTINGRIDHNFFSGYVVGIRGAVNNTSFSNSISIIRNDFSTSTGTAVTAHIQNPMQAWKIQNNTFEQGNALGNPSIVQCSATNIPITGLDFDTNWSGDSNTGTYNLFTGCTILGWNLHGNYFGGSSATNFLVAPATTNSGLVVSGNRFDSLNNFITGGANLTGVNASSNHFNNFVGNVLDAAGTGSFFIQSNVQFSNGGIQVFGPIEFWGGTYWHEGSAPTTLANDSVCYADSTTHVVKCSFATGPFFQMAQVITGTSAAFATATTAGTCVQNVTAVTGVTTSMVVSVSPVSTPGVGAVWSAFVSSAGNVTINECAVATSAGGTIAFNIRVMP